MKLTITPTDTITTLDSVAVRVWEGRTEQGIPCFVFVHQIAVAKSQDCTEFDRALKEQLPPPAEPIPLRMILG